MLCRSRARLVLCSCVLLLRCLATAVDSGKQQNAFDQGAHVIAGPKLLYVWEYDCIFDWEPVQVTDELAANMIAWLLDLHDRLTVTLQKPLGEDLTVSPPRLNSAVLSCKLRILVVCIVC